MNKQKKNVLIIPTRSQNIFLPNIHQVFLPEIIHRTKTQLIDDSDNLPKGCGSNIFSKNRVARTVNNSKRTKQLTISSNLLKQVLDHSKQTQIEQKRRNISLNLLRKQIHKEQTKQINRNYALFIKQFRKFKPLHQIKKQEYLKAQQQYFEKRRQQALKKIRQTKKPFNMLEILNHQKAYLKNKCKNKQTEVNEQQNTNTISKTQIQQKLTSKFKQQSSQYTQNSTLQFSPIKQDYNYYKTSKNNTVPNEPYQFSLTPPNKYSYNKNHLKTLPQQQSNSQQLRLISKNSKQKRSTKPLILRHKYYPNDFTYKKRKISINKSKNNQQQIDYEITIEDDFQEYFD